MLRRIRAVTAVLCLSLLTLLFLDFTGGLHAWFGWLAKVQFLPALLALNVGVVLALVVLTLLFGRVYCSAICPLGVFQDIVSWMAGRLKKRRFRYSPAMSWLRYGVLGVAALAFVLGVAPLVALLDPYGAYGRIAANILAPVYRLGNNLLAYFAESAGSYMFYTTDVWIKSGITLAVAVVTLAAVGFLAWRNGRTYCNTICPVGTILGVLARFSVFRPVINAEACTKCNKCARSCKASCIDVKTSRIDYSRCVACFDCMEQCSENALKYAPRSVAAKAGTDVKTDNRMAFAGQVSAEARRGFLSASALAITTAVVKAQQVQLQVDGGLADIADKQPPVRNTPLVPPGATGLRNMKQRCIACQLCVSACPNNVIRPSGKLSTLMQPEMSFENGYCRPECVECSAVCPSGAIKPVTAADKTAISVGYAVWNEGNCVVNTQKLPCTACERHCPTKAITLVALNPEDDNRPQQGFPGMRRPPMLRIPVINKELCTGCGACEYLCPARPFSAIYVEGNLMHHSI